MVQTAQKQGLKKGLLILLGVAMASAWVMLSQNQHKPPFQMIFNNGALIKVDLATSPAALERGLSERLGLAADEGMLFVFSEPGQHSFWMKDMSFDIDILWFNERCELIGLTENLTPKTYPNIYGPPEAVKYVLETNPGWAKNHGVAPGQKFNCGFIQEIDRLSAIPYFLLHNSYFGRSLLQDRKNHERLPALPTGRQAVGRSARGMKQSIIKRPKGASRRIKKPSGVSPGFFICSTSETRWPKDLKLQS